MIENYPRKIRNYRILAAVLGFALAASLLNDHAGEKLDVNEAYNAGFDEGHVEGWNVARATRPRCYGFEEGDNGHLKMPDNKRPRT